MGFSKWLRDIVDSKPRSLSLTSQHQSQPDKRNGPVEELCRDFGIAVDSVDFMDVKTGEQAASNKALLEKLLPAVEAKFGGDDTQVSLVLNALAHQFLFLSNTAEAA